jgi:aldehyde dehydrogenase
MRESISQEDDMATVEQNATIPAPGHVDSPVELESRYENFIGGHWAPSQGEYSDNLTPATGEAFTRVPRSTSEDVEFALDAVPRSAIACHLRKGIR